MDKAARPYRHTSLTRKWMHRQSFQVPNYGHSQVWTDHTGTRFSTQCKRTSISARTERRRSHAMEQSSSRGFSTSPTMDRRQFEENEVPQILLQARPAFRHPGYRAIREDLNVAQKSSGCFGPRRGVSGRERTINS